MKKYDPHDDYEARIKELEARLQKANELADTIANELPGNSVVAREQRVLEALTAYREAGNA